LIGTGTVLGLTSAVALARVHDANLFQVAATDPLTYAAVSVLLIVIAGLACVVPAGRAAVLNPLIALRHD
jgi:putative ABC transport system permease protein